MAHTLTTKKHIIIICGHYEGFDERIRTLADIELSIGDFVLTGGEIPAMAIIDSTVRLIDGVITKSHMRLIRLKMDFLIIRCILILLVLEVWMYQKYYYQVIMKILENGDIMNRLKELKKGVLI